MKFAGIDLSGNPKNNTGFCILDVESNKKTVSTCLLQSDSSIINATVDAGPQLTAVDAPLTYLGVKRKCDELLQEYGTLPVTLPGMEMLAKRGVKIAKELDGTNVKYIEVFPTATAKILGVYSRDDMQLQKNMMKLDLEGEINTRFLVRDELDSILAALTGYLHLLGQTKTVGDEGGVIVVPEI